MQQKEDKGNRRITHCRSLEKKKKSRHTISNN